MSCVKYTLTRCPSRIVMVGGICMNRSRMVVADCETLAAAPLVNAWVPFVVMAPPPSVISPAPAITPRAIGCAKDLEVVIVDLILQPLLADLVEAMELVKVYGVPVRHNQAVEDDGHPPLLTEACRANLLGFAKDDGSLGNEDMLTVVRI